MAEFDVFLSKSDFKFNCAHFVAYKGFRERLHGHNYRISVKVTGRGGISADGYLIDFGDIKKATRTICASLNEYFICPMLSDVLNITQEDTQLCVRCEDGSRFSFPAADCKILPLRHSSAEEISHYIYCEIIK
jgi:6-pyruvoyl-tetrahydropterin synthase